MGVDLALWHGDRRIQLFRGDDRAFTGLGVPVPEDFPRPSGIESWPRDGSGHIVTISVAELLGLVDKLKAVNYALIVGHFRRLPPEDRVVLFWH
jgi:hypothetical protein